MVKSRDRHGRGLRGRLAWPNPYTGAPVPLRSRHDPKRFFATCVADALVQIGARLAMKSDPARLRLGLAIVVLLVALRVGLGLVWRPDEIYTIQWL